MHRLAVVSRLCLSAFMLLFCAHAQAEPKIEVKTRYYTVHGTDGRHLLEQLNRRGPKQGFWTRSIAQTRYTTAWSAEWAYSQGYCRVQKAPVTLSLTMEFPRLAADAPRDLERRWDRFIAEVKKHENHHARLARQMVAEMEKAALATRIRGDRNCRRMESVLKQKVHAIMQAYERTQNAFDEEEHRKGGHVDQMVAHLIGD